MRLEWLITYLSLRKRRKYLVGNLMFYLRLKRLKVCNRLLLQTPYNLHTLKKWVRDLNSLELLKAGKICILKPV
ncbi:MAG: hypothetical protein EB141_09325 [Verrucomicrobia bacterium]|nr:hypothetical protein [Verrucomicrobiota bacterium]